MHGLLSVLHIYSFSKEINFSVKLTQLFSGSSPLMKIKPQAPYQRSESGASHQEIKHISFRQQRGLQLKTRSHTETLKLPGVCKEVLLCTFLYKNNQMVANEVRICYEEDKRDFIHHEHVNMEL